MRRISLLTIVGSLILCPILARAQILVANFQAGTVGKYDANTGATIDANFITGLSAPAALAHDGHGNLFVSSGNTVREYNATTGALINASFITTTDFVLCMTVDQSGHLYVGDFYGHIGKYDVTTGQPIDANLMGVPHPYGLAVSADGYVYATTGSLTSVEKFNAVTGVRIGNNFIRTIGDPDGIALGGNGQLYVADQTEGTLNTYNAATGALLASSGRIFGYLNGIAMADDGDLLIAGAGITRYDPDTGVKTSFIPSADGATAVLVLPEPTSIGTLGSAFLLLARRRRRITRTV